MKLEAGKLYRVLKTSFLFTPGTVDEIIFVCEANPIVGYDTTSSTSITFLVNGCLRKTTLYNENISYYLEPVKNCYYSDQ
jgi:hypothetical protein